MAKNQVLGQRLADPTAPPIDEPAGQKAQQFHQSYNVLRRTIGGGWHWNEDRTLLEAAFHPTIADAIAEDVAKLYETQHGHKPVKPLLDMGQADGHRIMLRATPEQVAQIKEMESAFGDRTLADQHQHLSSEPRASRAYCHR